MSCMRGTAEQGREILRALRGRHHYVMNYLLEIKTRHNLSHLSFPRGVSNYPLGVKQAISTRILHNPYRLS